MFDPKGIKIGGDKGGAGAPPLDDIMGKPLGGLDKPPEGDMGGGDNDLMGALKGAGFPDVTPDQVKQIEDILNAGGGKPEGLDMGGDMGGDVGGDKPPLPM